MREHHKLLSPSSLPMLERCPCFESTPAGEAAERGTIQHSALEHLIKNFKLKPEKAEKASLKKFKLDSEEESQVRWAFRKVLELVEEHGLPVDDIRQERRVTVVNNKFDQLTYGYIDIDCRHILFDYKSGQQRDSEAQIMAYAAGVMQEGGIKNATAYILYGKDAYAQRYDFNIDQCMSRVEGIEKYVMNPDAKPLACEYCGWCKSHLTCPAVIKSMQIIGNTIDPKDVDGLLSIKPGKADAKTLGKMKILALIAGTWAKAVDAEARSRLMNGKKVVGWKGGYRKGKQFITDLNNAHQALVEDASYLSTEEFISCCSASVPKLAKAAQAALGVGEKKAREEIEGVLGDIVGRGAEIFYVTKEK